MKAKEYRLSRRRFLQISLPVVLAACGTPVAKEQRPQPEAPLQGAAPTVAAQPAATASPADSPSPRPATAPAPGLLPATPACGDAPTVQQSAGPYYTPSTPKRTSLLEPGLRGTKLVLTGQVLTRGCQPVANAMLDFWQADEAGAYDNAGFKLRGHQFTDASGRYSLETIVPGHYPGRTRHIHVMVQAPNRPALTTQLYFPGEAQNARDGLFRNELLLEVKDVAGSKAATFHFVVNVS